MGRACFRCGAGLSAFASYCPGCGLPTRGPGRAFGALPALLAGGAVAACGVLARALVVPCLAEVAAAGGAFAAFLAALSAAAAATAPLTFAFGGGALPALTLPGCGVLQRIALGLGVGGLAVAALYASAEPDPSRAAMMVACAVLGAGLGADAARWFGRRVPFSWLEESCRPLPWPARAMAIASSLAVLLLGAPWLLVAFVALAAGAGARSVVARRRSGVSREEEVAP